MAKATHTTRRTILKALATIGLVPAVSATAKPKLTPDERIEAAKQEIQSALREKWPEWEVDEPKHRVSGLTSQNGERLFDEAEIIIF